MEQLDEIINYANKCFSCKNAKCKEGCPISTSIPEFIKKIKENNFEDAFYILQSNNLMSEICSNICPVEDQCMGSCIRGIKGEPIQINRLEKFINEWASANNIKYNPQLKELQNKKIAIIGAGPAGLSCAIELRKAGLDVVIYEKEDVCGGILEYGIPDFRLSKEILKKLIDKVKELGIDIKTNIEFGKNITIDALKAQGFKAFFLGIGAQKSTIYKLTDEPTESIYKSDVFLKKYNNKEKIKDLGITIVIGGGNVAFDSARAAIRMGADEVYILYRRNRELMPAREIELQEALQDGVKIDYQTKVISANVVNNNIEEIVCRKTKIENNKAVDIEGSDYIMKANTVIFAIGASIDSSLFDELEIKHENGLVCIDENYRTNISGIYAGGDLVETKSSVCRAIATGKKAAYSIIKEI